MALVINSNPILIFYSSPYLCFISSDKKIDTLEMVLILNFYLCPYNILLFLFTHIFMYFFLSIRGKDID